MPTKLDILTEVGKRLGDTDSAFLSDVLGPIFDRVLDELAFIGAIRALRSTGTFSLVADTGAYALTTELSLSEAPVRVLAVTVEAWGDPCGYLHRLDDMSFEQWQRRYRTDSGADDYQAGQPKYWRIYPDDDTLEVIPFPSSDYTDTAKVLYEKSASALGDGDNLTELKSYHIPGLIAGLVYYGAPFQDETIASIVGGDALAIWERFRVQMVAEAREEPGRMRQMKIRE